ncbi:sensor histidine kinase [Pontibacter chitinilyticus]|uniref:sensor histidine kinase n=1 Tax=Pontibacter chitinilyticus TaxID=2674989 RepID=UPI00321B5529
MRASCFLLWLLWLLPPLLNLQTSHAAALPLIRLENQKNVYTIGADVALLEDPTGKLTLDQVQQLKGSFIRSRQQAPVYGPTTSAVWCLFRMRNTSKEDKWYLEVASSYLHEVDLYRQNAAGGFDRLKAGAGQPFESRFVHTNRLILPLQLPAGAERTYYMRLRSRNILRFPLKVATMPALYESNHTIDLVNGIYLGLMFALMMYNLFVYLSLRDKAYLYYILFVLSVALEVASIRGYLLEWLPEPLTWLVNARFFCGLAILFSIPFANAVLQVKQYLPALYPWRWVVIGCLGIVLLLNLLQWYVWAFACMLLTFIPVYLYAYGAGILIYRQGFKPALYYTLGSAALGLGILIYILKDTNLLPETPFTESSLQLGSVVEAVVLSYALASKFNIYRLEKEQAQELAMQQATAFSQQLIQSQENERKRIAAELHDSVGQSLILIRNRATLIRNNLGRSDKTEVQLDALSETVANTIQDIRTISYGLRPYQLDLLGLTHAIRGLAEEVAGATQLQLTEEIEQIDDLFPPESEINIYRIVQECLNNMVKHAGATMARLAVHRQGEEVELWLEDNGRGISPAVFADGTSRGFGLLGIEERLKILAGTITYHAGVPRGTRIHILIPIPVAHAKA